MVVQLPFASFMKLLAAHCVANTKTGRPDPDLSRGPAQPTESLPIRDTMARFRQHHRKQSSRSLASEGPWKVDTPFGPPRISHLHFPRGIRRIRGALSKLFPSARAERAILRQKNRYKIPLTERNMDTFVTAQEFTDARYPNQYSTEIQVVAWLNRVY